MAMPNQHPFTAITGSNLWNTLGLQDLNRSWCACFNPTYQPSTQSVDAASSSSKSAPRAPQKEAPRRTEEYRRTEARRTEDSPSESSIESDSFRKSPCTTQQTGSGQELSGLDFSGAPNSDCDEDDSSDRIPECFRYLEFELDVMRDSRGDKLGMDVLHGHVPGLLRILSISEGDAVDKANKKSLAQDPSGPNLRVGDFILQVNQKTESVTDMVSELHKRASLRIAAVRILPEEPSSDSLQDQRGYSVDTVRSDESTMISMSYNTYLAKKAEELTGSGQSLGDELQMEHALKLRELDRNGAQVHASRETQTNGNLGVSSEQQFAKRIPRYSRNDTSGNDSKEIQTNGVLIDASLGQEIAKLVSRARDGIEMVVTSRDSSKTNSTKETQTQTQGMFFDSSLDKQILKPTPRNSGMQEAPFVVGDLVKVLVNMNSNCQEAYNIPVDVMGRVIKIDEDGDALIDFHCIPKNAWISKEQMHKLAKQAISPEETQTSQAVSSTETQTSQAVSSTETQTSQAVSSTETQTSQAVSSTETQTSQAVSSTETQTSQAVSSTETQTSSIVSVPLEGKKAQEEKHEKTATAVQMHDRIEARQAIEVQETQKNATFVDAFISKQTMTSCAQNGKTEVQANIDTEDGMTPIDSLDKSRLPWDLPCPSSAKRDGSSYLHLLGCTEGLGCLRGLQGRPLIRSREPQKVDATSASALHKAASTLSQSQNGLVEVKVPVQTMANTELTVQVEPVQESRLNDDIVPRSNATEESSSIFAVSGAITCVKEDKTQASDAPRFGDRPLDSVSASNVPIACSQTKKPEAPTLSPIVRRAVFSDKLVEEVRSFRKLTPPRITCGKEEAAKTASSCRRPSPILTKMAAFPGKEIVKEAKEAVSVPMVALSKPTLQWAFEDRHLPDHSPRSPSASTRRPSRDEDACVTPKDQRKKDPWFKDQTSAGEFGSFHKTCKEAKDDSSTGALKSEEEIKDREVLPREDGTFSFSADNFDALRNDSVRKEEKSPGQSTEESEVSLSPLHTAVGADAMSRIDALSIGNATRSDTQSTALGLGERLNGFDLKAEATQRAGAFDSLPRTGQTSGHSGTPPGELPDVLKKAFQKAWDVVQKPTRVRESSPRLPVPSRAVPQDIPTARTPTPARSSRSGTPTPRRSLSSKRTNSQEVVFRAEDAVGAEEVQKAMEDAYTEMLGSQQSRHRASSIRSSEICLAGPLVASSRPHSAFCPKPVVPPIALELEAMRETFRPSEREVARETFQQPGASDSTEFPLGGRSRLMSSSRKSLSKRTQSPEAVFKVEDFLDAEEAEYAEEAEFARICDGWSRNRHPSSSSSCKLSDSSQDATTSFSRSMSLPASRSHENSTSKSLLSPRLVTGDGYHRAAFRVEDVVGEAESMLAMETEYDQILHRWSRHTFRLSSSSSSVESKAQKMFVSSDYGCEYFSPKRRARSCPAMQRADSLGRPIVKNGSHHCIFVDEMPPRKPLVDVVEYEASPVIKAPPFLQPFRPPKCRRRYDSEE